jgi:Zn-dependent oligopeptidase
MKVGPNATFENMRQLVVQDLETGRDLGTIFLDLFDRDSKFKGSATFTLVCGRLLPSSESSNTSDSYQFPRVVVSTNIPPPRNGFPALLSHSQANISIFLIFPKFMPFRLRHYFTKWVMPVTL